MRKRVLVVLALMVCLLAQMVPVSAAGGVDISSLPGPPDGTELISSVTQENGKYVLDQLGRVSLVNVSEASKIVVYYDGSFWAMKSEQMQLAQGEDPVGISFLHQFGSLEDALSVCDVTEQYEEFTSFPSDAYVLFCSSTALDVNGVRYCVSSSDLLSFTNDPYKQDVGNNELLLSVSISHEDKDAVPVFTLNYSLPFKNKFGVMTEELLASVIIDREGIVVTVDDAHKTSSGALDFTMNSLENREYKVEVFTNNGTRYETTFVVDFADEVSQPGLMDSKYTGSFDAPIVTFDGISNEAGIAVPLTVKMLSNMPAELVFNDESSDGYVTEFEFTLSHNGRYSYVAVSEIGRVTEGVLEVTCFDDEAMGVLGLDLDTSGTHLVQTGLSSYSSLIIYSCAIIAIVCIAAGAYFIKKRGVNNEI